MFCDTCHWYTAGEAICPHCGAPQGPEEIEEIAALPEEPTPLPEPEPTPEPSVPVPEVSPPPPAPKPVPTPIPAPIPAPSASSVSRPAPTPSGGNKQGFKALALILAGTVVLIVVLLFAEMAREDTYYTDIPNYDDSYFYDDSYLEADEPPLEEAQAGDVVSFGNAQWRVLDRDPPEYLLLLLEYDIYLWPEEVDEYLGKRVEMNDDVYIGELEFSYFEFARILLTPDGNALFQLSPEEMENYGIEPPEIWDDELVPVRPAIRVYI